MTVEIKFFDGVELLSTACGSELKIENGVGLGTQNAIDDVVELNASGVFGQIALEQIRGLCAKMFTSPALGGGCMMTGILTCDGKYWRDISRKLSRSHLRVLCGSWFCCVLRGHVTCGLNTICCMVKLGPSE